MNSYWHSHKLFCLTLGALFTSGSLLLAFQMSPNSQDSNRYIELQTTLAPPKADHFTLCQQKHLSEKHLLTPKRNWHLLATSGITQVDYSAAPGAHSLDVSEDLEECYLHSEDLQIRSERARYLQNSQEVFFEGAVSILHPALELTCDQAHVILPHEATLYGHLSAVVRLSRSQITIQGKSAHILFQEQHIDKITLNGPLKFEETLTGKFATAESGECWPEKKLLILYGTPTSPVSYLDTKTGQRLKAEKLIIEEGPHGESVRAEGMVQIQLPCRSPFKKGS